VLVLLLVLVLDLLAIRAEKRARSFRNCSVPASVAAQRAVFSTTSTISNFEIWIKVWNPKLKDIDIGRANW
jgi:hypothetical protein